MQASIWELRGSAANRGLWLGGRGREREGAQASLPAAPGTGLPLHPLPRGRSTSAELEPRPKDSVSAEGKVSEVPGGKKMPF